MFKSQFGFTPKINQKECSKPNEIFSAYCQGRKVCGLSFPDTAVDDVAVVRKRCFNGKLMKSRRFYHEQNCGLFQLMLQL